MRHVRLKSPQTLEAFEDALERWQSTVSRNAARVEASYGQKARCLLDKEITQAVGGATTAILGFMINDPVPTIQASIRPLNNQRQALRQNRHLLDAQISQQLESGNVGRRVRFEGERGCGPQARPLGAGRSDHARE